MKFITALTFLLLSTALFASTPFSFKCTSSSDGKCSITTDNAHQMELGADGVYNGVEGAYSMFWFAEEGGSYMFIFKGNTEVAQAEGTYLAVPVAGGYTGIILVDGIKDIPAFIKLP